MRRILLVTAALALSLTACEQLRESAGISKKAPDEFRVVRNAPLSLPPNYALRPPEPGARPLPQLDPRREAQQAALGRDAGAVAPTGAMAAGTMAAGAASASAASAGESAGEEALLRNIKVGDTPTNIRAQVDEESAILAADNRNFVERLMFWRDQPPPGTVVDARGEARRIQENAALGRPPQTGSTPTIERKSNAGVSLF
ncbi:MAG: DUF3035 domain-containing protein [Alphaproteobacteria bacterium]|nr:DUF3035 domain-containing protein [Alphaproteobacteria bacterium]MCB9928476.1 DUF3035 domain-containing protein [Alphaproteobacteria bacterium]